MVPRFWITQWVFLLKGRIPTCVKAGMWERYKLPKALRHSKWQKRVSVISLVLQKQGSLICRSRVKEQDLKWFWRKRRRFEKMTYCFATDRVHCWIELAFDLYLQLSSLYHGEFLDSICHRFKRHLIFYTHPINKEAEHSKCLFTFPCILLSAHCPLYLH